MVTLRYIYIYIYTYIYTLSLFIYIYIYIYRERERERERKRERGTERADKLLYSTMINLSFYICVKLRKFDSKCIKKLEASEMRC